MIKERGRLVRRDDLTVVVPTRNEARNIGAFLDSIPSDVPLVVVDSSDDATPDMVQRLRPDNTLVVRRRANVALARQIGAALARTGWLVFTDADIEFHPEYFGRLADYSAFDTVYGSKATTSRYRCYHQAFAACQSVSHRLGIPAASGSNLVVRSAPFRSVGGFDLDLSCNEDSELVWRLKRAGYAVAFAPDLIVYARDHRRLDRGVRTKIMHTLVRCCLLYAGVLPRPLKQHDWGYWQLPSTKRTIGPESTALPARGCRRNA